MEKEGDDIKCVCKCHLNKKGERIKSKTHMWCANCHEWHRNDKRHPWFNKPLLHHLD